MRPKRHQTHTGGEVIVPLLSNRVPQEVCHGDLHQAKPVPGGTETVLHERARVAFFADNLSYSLRHLLLSAGHEYLPEM